MKKFLMGIVWFVVLYLGLCFLGGAVLASQISIDDYSSIDAYNDACYEAGVRAGAKYRPYLLAIPALLAAIGSIAGVLPGTGDGRKGQDQ
jgi:hypothetical protein